MRIRTLCLIVMLSGWGCGGDDGGGTETFAVPSDGGAGARYECDDDDGDGYGMYCDHGRDCDDNDPDVTDLCYRCRENNPGCACEKGTRPEFCDPDDIQTTMNGVTGTLVCSEGTRYCREEMWSDCEILLEYATFIPD